MNTDQKITKMAAYPIFLAFLCMGFGDAVGPLVGLIKEKFDLTYFEAQMIPLSGFIMFGVLSVLMGVYQDRKGKKFILNLGLIIAFLGLIIPIIGGMYGPEFEILEGDQSKYYILLLSILLLGAGATILQVAGNPIMRDVSEEGKYSSNLSLAQAIKAIGSSLGFLLPVLVFYLFDWNFSILFPVFSFMILINVLWLNSKKIVERKEEGASPATIKSCLSLLGNGYVLMMVMGIFLYVGAEVSMSSGVPMLLNDTFNIDVEKFGVGIAWALFFLPILIGRFSGSMILKIISPKRFLIITVLISAGGVLLMYTGVKEVTFAGIVLVGLGFANIFPLIFSITVDKMPERTNELSGLMVTAIVGGAIIPPVMGYVADQSSILIGFLVPLVCIVYITLVSLVNLKK